MAEFQKVIAEWKRLCKSRLYSGCSGCPVYNGVYCRIGNKTFSDDFEDNILKWAAANPESRYPTWREWHHTKPRNEQLAPMLLCHFVPCPHDTKYPDDRKCCSCYDSPIPADIAKKHGVEPIKEDKP